MCVLWLIPGLVAAQQSADDGEQRDTPRPLVAVEVNIELAEINRALRASSESFSEISESFRIIAEGGQLDPELQQQMQSVMDNMDRLVELSNSSVDALPSLVERSRQQVVEQGNRFFANLKFWSVVTLVLLGVILAVAAVCFYYFVLQPMQRTLLAVTGDIRDMARAMETTSKSLEVSSEVHRDLLKMQRKQ
jgi:hypothetical protein